MEPQSRFEHFDEEINRYFPLKFATLAFDYA
jgi:hypothetical protein